MRASETADGLASPRLSCAWQSALQQCKTVQDRLLPGVTARHHSQASCCPLTCRRGMYRPCPRRHSTRRGPPASTRTGASLSVSSTSESHASLSCSLWLALPSSTDSESCRSVAPSRHVPPLVVLPSRLPLCLFGRVQQVGPKEVLSRHAPRAHSVSPQLATSVAMGAPQVPHVAVHGDRPGHIGDHLVHQAAQVLRLPSQDGRRRLSSRPWRLSDSQVPALSHRPLPVRDSPLSRTFHNVSQCVCSQCLCTVTYPVPALLAVQRHSCPDFAAIGMGEARGPAFIQGHRACVFVLVHDHMHTCVWCVGDR